jgi:alpha-L-fucosidase 2
MYNKTKPMTNRILKYCIIGALGLSSCSQTSQQSNPLCLWYNHPANSAAADIKNGWENEPGWLNALPVGNGFLGAMVFGDVNHERIQLNEKTLWSGSPDDGNNPEAAKNLAKIRRLLFEGMYKEANTLTEETQICKGAGSGLGNGANVPFGCFQTLGDLWLDFGKTTTFGNYRRKLDLDRSVVKIEYNQDGVNFWREIFASYPDRVLVMRLTGDKKAALSFRAKLNRPERFETHSDKSTMWMTGTLDNGKGGDGMKYAACLKAIPTGGELAISDSSLVVTNADEVVLRLAASTNYKQEYPRFQGEEPGLASLKQLPQAASKSYNELLSAHTSDYKNLFDKVNLTLTETVADTISTDIRLQNQASNPDDLHLQQLYFQFGRYLLISSSRQGSLPANLQGIWANKIQTPWNCDYHTNINLQMNYMQTDAKPFMVNLNSGKYEFTIKQD